MARNGRSRIYKRGDRYWGDFRALGGKREPLVPPSESAATTDRLIAEKLLADRLSQLQQARRNKVLLGVESDATLAEFASRHLVLKKKSGLVTDGHLAETERRLKRACDYFGAGRELSSLGAAELQKYVSYLSSLPNRRGGTLGPAAVRHHLNALSNLYRRAQSEAVVSPGFNPVQAMMDKPIGKPQEARWLEIDEAALFLEASHRYEPSLAYRDPVPFLYPLIATFLLTGGRTQEVLGLEVSDVSFDRSTVTFRPNDWRRLKTVTSHRSVPLWPQLKVILQEYVFGGESPLREGLLFPSPRTGQMLHDFRKGLDQVAIRAGWKVGEIRSKMFRHTYCAARLQTLDRGHPVSMYTVGRELGHGGDSLVKKVYGHMGETRHRSEHVEYLIENHPDSLAERLEALG